MKRKRREYRTKGQCPLRSRTGPITVHYTEGVPTRSANGFLVGSPLCCPPISWRKVNCQACLSIGGHA